MNEKGILNGDCDPTNILISDGHVIFIDFRKSEVNQGGVRRISDCAYFIAQLWMRGALSNDEYAIYLTNLRKRFRLVEL